MRHILAPTVARSRVHIHVRNELAEERDGGGGEIRRRERLQGRVKARSRNTNLTAVGVL